ncbi:MAG: hypothetical protein AAF961_07045 [Planctomycetota bacterium]
MNWTLPSCRGEYFYGCAQQLLMTWRKPLKYVHDLGDQQPQFQGGFTEYWRPDIDDSRRAIDCGEAIGVTMTDADDGVAPR